MIRVFIFKYVFDEYANVIKMAQKLIFIFQQKLEKEKRRERAQMMQAARKSRMEKDRAKVKAAQGKK